MSDDAAIYRGTVDPLGGRKRRFERRHGWGRVGFGAAAVGLGVVDLVSGGLLGLGHALVGLAVVAIDLRVRRIRRGVVDLHDHGLRISDTDAAVRWDQIVELRVGYTVEQDDRSRASGVTIVRADGARFELSIELRDLEALRVAIEAATTPRLRAAAEAVLDSGGPLRFGHHRLDRTGLHATEREVAWPALGPVRLERGCMILRSEVGRFEVAIEAVPNPAVVVAIIAARGRAA